MRILITGVAGFIASHVAERLLLEDSFDETIDILGIDNFETGKEANITENLTNTKKLMFREGDITELSFMYDMFNIFKPDIVIHAAASYKHPSNWVHDAKTNTFGTAVVCELCRMVGVKKLIYFQTSLCYGVSPPPFDPNWPSQIRISYPLNPAPNSYAITKTAAEQLIAMSGVPFISLRLANIYGPRNLTGVIPTFYKKLVNKEVCNIVNSRRDFIYIDDLVNLVVRIVSGEGKQNYYHVSSGKDYAIGDIFGFMSGYMFPDSYREINYQTKERSPDDASSILLDPSKTYKDFPDWKANTPLEDGLKKTITWYEKHPIKETYTHLKKE